MLAAPYAPSSYLPNRGIMPDMKPPRPLSHSRTYEARYPEPDCVLPVYILVRPGSPARPAPRDRPWSLIWPLALAEGLVQALKSDPFYHAPEQPEFAPLACPVPSHGSPGSSGATQGIPVAYGRSLEASYDAQHKHFAFWGGCTRGWNMRELRGARWVLVGVLDRQERMALEALAEQVRVMKAEHGWWNGQNWIVALLNGAVDEGIIKPEQRDAAVLAAALAPS
ncbi:unnamed protein product [Peniophora sp. CBMAI 1063]|nr:unnamed protein product [Peniophora sp. CBMAI 1063]